MSIETVIWGIPPGETESYKEQLLFDRGIKLTDGQVQKVLDVASSHGFHSFRVKHLDLATMGYLFGANVLNADK